MATAIENTCVCRVCAGVRVIIDQIFSVVEKYRWLLDAYVVDFYEENLWNKLPGHWRSLLEDITPDELGSWILRETPCKRVWPLSLIALRRVIGILEIRRDQQGEIIFECKKNPRRIDLVPSRCKIDDKKQNAEKTEEAYTYDSHPKLKNLFRKHVKAKKRHEIISMAEITADCATLARCECAVDIGAGMGHLSRMLAYKYGLCVVCIEQQPLLSQQAQKWDDQLEVTVSKYLSNFCGQRPQHMLAKIDASHSSGKQLVDRITQQFTSSFVINSRSTGFGLVGLHPCGDLAATLLKVYSEHEEAKFICVAGCCYMKLTLEDEAEKPRGYPLSEYLLSSESNRLSYIALDVACHAIENYCDRLKAGVFYDLKVHAYRAALESLLVSKNSALHHAKLRSVKVKEDTTFEQYCTAATENFKPEDQPRGPEDFENPRIMSFLNRWQQVVTFGSLRVMLAPLVETAVLLDRFLFLSERSLAPQLRPAFDPKLSPRNIVLTSIK